jgi:hypothetical protein
MNQIKNAIPNLPGLDLGKVLNPQALEATPGSDEPAKSAEAAADSPTGFV